MGRGRHEAVQRTVSLETFEPQLRAQVDDWEAWLVFADWLTEHDDARGEVLVLEHRYATGGLTGPIRQRTKQRIDAIIARERGRWLRGWTCPDGTRLHWRGGFVRGVELRGGRAAIASFERLAAHPAGRLLATLDLACNQLGTAAVADLVRSEALRTITRLDLPHNLAGPKAAEAIATSTNLGALDALDLDHNHIGDAGLQAILESSQLPVLRTLRLGDNAITSLGRRAIARAALARRCRIWT